MEIENNNKKKRNVDTPTPVVTTVNTDTNDENISTTKRDHTNKKNMVSQLLFLLVFFFRKNSEKPPQKKNPNQSFKRLHTSFFCAIVSPRGIFFFCFTILFFFWTFPSCSFPRPRVHDGFCCSYSFFTPDPTPYAWDPQSSSSPSPRTSRRPSRRSSGDHTSAPRP